MITLCNWYSAVESQLILAMVWAAVGDETASSA